MSEAAVAGGRGAHTVWVDGAGGFSMFVEPGAATVSIRAPGCRVATRIIALAAERMDTIGAALHLLPCTSGAR